MKVSYARRAQADIQEIFDHVQNQDPVTAKLIVGEFKARCEALADNPFLNPATDVRDVRRMPLTRYPFTIFYKIKIKERQIFILRMVRSLRVRNLGRVPR